MTGCVIAVLRRVVLVICPGPHIPRYIAPVAVFFLRFPGLNSLTDKHSDALGAKWHLNRSWFGIRIDHNLAFIS
ncbi:hypothetical protein, partial [Escherichia coli]|uniref:hypothetical protein n=1 Tax=Escherichia coli TaxID=562 RepID=UPI001A93C827